MISNFSFLEGYSSCESVHGHKENFSKFEKVLKSEQIYDA